MSETRNKIGRPAARFAAVVNGYSLPELCRMHAPNCVNLLSCIVDGTDEEGAEVKYATKDRIRASQILLERGFGRPLDFQTMRDTERNNAANTIDMTEQELLDAIQADLPSDNVHPLNDTP